MRKYLSTINTLLVFLAITISPAASAAIVDACASESPTTGSNLSNGDAICLPNGSNSSSIQYYYIQVPANTSTLYIRTAHGTGNGNLYYNASTWATATANTQSSTNSGNTESINVSNPAQGYRFLSVIGQQSGMTLLVTTSNPDGGSSSGGSSSGGSSSGGSSSGGSSSGGSSSGGLSNGQTVSGIGASTGNYTQTYYIDVPSGASGLKIATSGGSGDADLYVKKGSEPTDTSYDCRPYDSGNNETCGVGGDTLATSQGRFYIKLKAYATFSNVSLTASYSGGGSSSGGSSSGGSSSGGSSSGGSSSGGSSSGGSSSGGSSSGGLSSGQTVSGIGASTGNYTQTYYIDVPSGASGLKIATSGGSGDADLYVKKGSEPTDTSYDCRPYDSGNNETCGVGGDTLATSQGRFYIKLKAYATFSGVSLTASYTGGGSSSGGSSSGGSSSGGSVPNACGSESPHSGNLITLNDAVCVPNGTFDVDIKYYQINLANSVSQLQIRTAHGSGNAELLYRKADWASSASHDQSSNNSGNSESITINNAVAGNHYISVVGVYSGMTLLLSGDGGGSSSGGSGSSSGGSSSGAMIDACASSDPTDRTDILDGVVYCVKSVNQFTSFSIALGNEPNRATSVAITTSYGLGNLSLEGRAHGTEPWPQEGDDSLRSSHVGNTECLVITNIDRYWGNITLRGLFKGASVVADLNATTCRATPGAADPGNTGYQFNKAHVIIQPFRFNSVDLEFTPAQIETEMQLVKQYFAEQSYGNFDVTWEIKPKITIATAKSTFDNDKSKWGPEYRARLLETGVDPFFPGDATLIMVTSPPIGPVGSPINSQAGPPSMEIYTYKGSTIAHEMGHALGLHHSMTVEGGNSILNGNSNDSIVNYGNVFGMMGMGGHTWEEFNLMYKYYFKGPRWFSDNDVPLVTTSGTYRIYAYDYGTPTGHGAPGNIGFRLKSGNGLYTYFVEYMTNQNTEKDDPNPLRTPLLQNGILVNLMGYMDTNVTPWWNHTSALLDFTPNSRSSSWDLEDVNDAPLQIGKSWTDTWNGFRIEPVAKGGELGTANAWIEVKVDILQ